MQHESTCPWKKTLLLLAMPISDVIKKAQRNVISSAAGTLIQESCFKEGELDKLHFYNLQTLFYVAKHIVVFPVADVIVIVKCT